MNETLINQIGEQLKAARLNQNLTLDDIQATTKIQVRYLDAIENNNLSILPGDFYVRAFIRQYALAVGLNPEDLLGEVAPESISRSHDLSRAHRDNDGIVRAGIDHRQTAKSRISGMMPTIWLGILVVVVLIMIWFVLTHIGIGSQNSSNDTDNVSVSTSTVPSSSSARESSSSASSSRKPAKKAATKLDLGTPEQNAALQTTIYNLSGQESKKHTVKITARGTGTNVKVSVGANVLLDENVTTDQTISIPADSEAVNVQFTNVVNATMTFDGQKVTVLDTATPFWNVLFNLDK
ncbi:helix-turn-helix domain-containing protein [Leuconostoc carnosum]|uniref:Transcriptional regulator n=2 Tax=Leuconostoc carnosum TaxID=1252 RepID=K0DCW8_LEUCJ|nr:MULTISPECIES: helix-turn-helix domain-containing protein [Leuconostoc]AFT81387.1 hypothetical protein C270_02370 [Leuconostoc carnosum JB16]KAA8325992.1 helix-turn-helix domain-containing protein [Leuconostoc carnosum]KAA8330200.1 helix-turn-helix domain-containing protein [Leuconostoc carnosum]KAA8362276.1 helix-turn-helix domain-containing protein [Leuconostoc carnosum]KAA8366825.1 helix-turn-helix domain-containing protein [Leuconostoc carnosum]